MFLFFLLMYHSSRLPYYSSAMNELDLIKKFLKVCSTKLITTCRYSLTRAESKDSYISCCWRCSDEITQTKAFVCQSLYIWQKLFFLQYVELSPKSLSCLQVPLQTLSTTTTQYRFTMCFLSFQTFAFWSLFLEYPHGGLFQS